MPDDTITLVSTTDTPAQVLEALTNKPAEKPVEKAPEKTDADTGEPAAPAETPPPAAADAKEGETEPEPDNREGTKRLRKLKDQIDELTRNKHIARRDVEAEEARLSELRRQRQDLEASGKPADPPAAAAPADTKATGRPEPKLDAADAEGNAKYATYEDYLSDHAVWTKEEAVLAARQTLEEERKADRERIERDTATRAVTERVAAYNAKLDTFKKTHADFDAAFEDAKDAVQDALVAIGPQALKVIDGYTVFDAEDGPALTYYLLKRPDELKAIALKGPQQQIVHLARLEERIRQGSATKPGLAPAAAPVTKAPEPIKPVGSGPTATTVSSDDESFVDYRARRERELRAKRGY